MRDKMVLVNKKYEDPVKQDYGGFYYTLKYGGAGMAVLGAFLWTGGDRMASPVLVIGGAASAYLAHRHGKSRNRARSEGSTKS